MVLQGLVTSLSPGQGHALTFQNVQRGYPTWVLVLGQLLHVVFSLIVDTSCQIWTKVCISFLQEN